MGSHGRRSLSTEGGSGGTFLERCCALDVHKRQVTACVHVPDAEGRRGVARRVLDGDGRAAWSARLAEGCGRHARGDGGHGRLLEAGLQLAGGRFELLLVNAQHIKTVPGRKTDVQDAEWIAGCSSTGCCGRASCRPEPRELRDLTRYRRSLVRERSARPTGCRSCSKTPISSWGRWRADVLGASGRAMLRALCAGETDPRRWRSWRKGKLRRKIPALRAALDGRFSEPSRAARLATALAHRLHRRGHRRAERRDRGTRAPFRAPA